MAFFSDRNNEYFSLSLNPAEDKQSYVFALNKQQSYVSSRFSNYLLLISMCIFLAVICLIIIEHFDLNKRFLSDLNQELLVLALAGSASVITFSEFAFFMWVRRGKRSLLTENDRRNLKGIYVLKTRSWMAYLIFLLTITVPLISFMALPGGWSRLIADTLHYNNGLLFFCIQLIILFLALTIFSIKRIVTLLRFKIN